MKEKDIKVFTLACDKDKNFTHTYLLSPTDLPRRLNSPFYGVLMLPRYLLSPTDLPRRLNSPNYCVLMLPTFKIDLPNPFLILPTLLMAVPTEM